MATVGMMALTILDAMNEVAWCYLEGFGCKKDKVYPTPNLA